MQFRFWLQTGEQNTECTNCHKRRISGRYIVMVPCYLTAHVRMVSSSWHGDLCSQASKLSHTIVDLTWKTRFMSTHALFPSVCLETKVHRCIVKRKPNLFACLTFAIYQHKGNLWIRCEQRVFNSLWPKKDWPIPESKGTKFSFFMSDCPYTVCKSKWCPAHLINIYIYIYIYSSWLFLPLNCRIH